MDGNTVMISGLLRSDAGGGRGIAARTRELVVLLRPTVVGAGVFRASR